MVSMQGGGGSLKNIVYGQGAQPVQDPLAELKALLQANGVGANIDYSAAAQSAYAPQYGYLDQAAKDANARAAAAGKDVSNLYSALAAGISGQAGGIKQNYGQGLADAAAAYKAAMQGVGQQYDQTRNSSADILQRLGIQEAGTNVMNKANESENLIQGILQANNLGTTNALRQGQQSALTYNTQQAGAAKLAGAEAQTGLKRQLSDFLNQIAMQRANTQTEQNKYRLSLEGNAASQNNDLFDKLMQIKKFEYGMAKDKADYELKAGATGQNQKLDPLGSMQTLAYNLYGGNTQAASNAAKAVTDAVMRFSQDTYNSGKTLTLPALMDYIRHRMSTNPNFGDESLVQRLAAEYMKQTG